MSKTMKIVLIVAVLFAGAAYMLWQKPQKESVIITVTDNGWDSQKFHNEVARLAVEHAYDAYELRTSTASSTMNWQSMIAGDVDLDIESWTDNIASYSDDRAAGKVVDAGVLVADSAQGLYVPRYVIEGDSRTGLAPLAPDLRHVRDLKKYAHLFPDPEEPGKGRIYGSIPGWMVDGILYKKFLYYALDKNYNYMRMGSEATLFASLASAYNLQQPWIGYCYEPTWIVGKLDLVLLEDEPYEQQAFQEGKTEFPSQQLKIVSSSKFAAKAPELLPFFEKYKTSSVLVSKALAHLDDTGATHAEAAVWFLKNNDGLIDEWLAPTQAAKLREYLKTQQQ